MKPRKPKILFLDIETAPNTVYTWGLYGQDIGINQIVQNGYMLCWAAKWAGEKKIHSDALINHKIDFLDNPTNDYKIAKSIHEILSEADIVVAHNGDTFDLRWLNTLFILHDLPPAPKFRTVDTKKCSKNTFRFASNKLDHIANRLSLGQKVKNEGFGLWRKCMKGNKKAWSDMLKYNKQDVHLLEELYFYLRPYIKNHPNLAAIHSPDKLACPDCGSDKAIKRGIHYTNECGYQRYRCSECNRWYHDKQRIVKTKVKVA